MLVDSWYDAYLGVIVLVRVIDGRLKKGQTIRMMGTDARYPVDRVGVFTPKMVMVDASSVPARSASSPRRSRKWPTRASATRSPRTRSRRPNAARLQAGPAGGLLRHVSGRRGRFRGSARRHGQAARSTTRRFRSRWKPRPRSVSASAAVFWACCIWRSCRSGWSANSTSTSSPPRRRSSTACI